MESELAEGEELLTDPDEQLWRNAHPTFLDGERLSSQVFTPTAQHDWKLSLARSSKVSASDHFVEYTEKLNLDSIGVWSVSVAEVNLEGLTGVYDAESDAAPDPCPAGHTSVDFSNASRSQVGKIGRRLRDKAVERGCQHP